jgi:hypothetical protein
VDGHLWVNNRKINLIWSKLNEGAWTELISFRIQTSDRLLWTQQCTLSLHEILIGPVIWIFEQLDYRLSSIRLNLITVCISKLQAMVKLEAFQLKLSQQKVSRPDAVIWNRSQLAIHAFELPHPASRWRDAVGNRGRVQNLSAEARNSFFQLRFQLLWCTSASDIGRFGLSTYFDLKQVKFKSYICEWLHQPSTSLLIIERCTVVLKH